MKFASQPLVFALSESRKLGEQFALHANLPLAPLEERTFEGGEFKLRPLTSVRDTTVFVVQTLAGSDDASVAHRAMRLLFACFGLRDAGASRIIAVIPYLAYARKDRRTQARDPVNSRYIAQLLETAGVDRVIAVDVHNPAALDNSFRIPVDHLSAIPMFVDHFSTLLAFAPLTVVSPDVGGIKRAQIFRELLQTRVGEPVELAFIEKRRVGGQASSGSVVGQIGGRTAILLDDLCATGGTLTRAATSLREAGATAVHAAFVHAPCLDGLHALARCESIAHIVFTDTVGNALPAEPTALSERITCLPIAPLLGEAARCMNDGTPLAPLLQQWPPAHRL